MDRQQIESEIQKAFPTVKIESDGCITHIYINDKEVDGVTGFKIIQEEGGDFPTIHLDILAAKMQINTPMVPALPKPLKPYYISKLQLLQETTCIQAI